MKVLNLYEKFNKKIDIALGYFDSLHLGHFELIKNTRLLGNLSAVFTFSNNHKAILNNGEKEIFNFDERMERLDTINVDICIIAKADKEFLNLGGCDFLNILISNFNINTVTIGEDYRCGIGGEMNAEDVKNYLSLKGIATTILPLINYQSKKISSTDIKKMLEEGKIKEANALMVLPFSFSGQVVGGRQDGSRVLGFPTANLEYPKTKITVKEGVYKTITYINGKSYKSLTNIGMHPTFDDNIYNIETFIFDFSENIYDVFIKVVLVERIRGVIKFESAQALRNQITADIKRAKED